jgi:hypothetical protein
LERFTCLGQFCLSRIFRPCTKGRCTFRTPTGLLRRFCVLCKAFQILLFMRGQDSSVGIERSNEETVQSCLMDRTETNCVLVMRS